MNAETAENEGSGARAEKVIIWTAEALRCFWDALTTLCKSGRLGHISVSARGSFACPKSSVPPSQETATGEMVVLYCDAPFVGDVRDFLGGITVSGPYRRKPLSAEAGVRLLLVDARGRALASL